MPGPVDPKAFLNLCEMAIDNRYELEAIGELLEQKGLLTKQEIFDLATDLKRKAPPPIPQKPHNNPSPRKRTLSLKNSWP